MAQYFDLKALSNKNENIKNFLQSSINNSGDSSAFSSSKIALDSHTNSERVLSNILTGLITLNPDFFEPDSLVNANGSIALKDYALFSDANTSGEVTNDNFLKKITRTILGANNDNSVGINVLTLVNFIDKKFWGFYAYLIYNSTFAHKT